MKGIPLLLTATVVALLTLSACKKDGEDIRPEDIQKATEFTSFVAEKKFRPTAFYSDKPIDYLTEDEFDRSETDLWQYAKSYIKDDQTFFVKGTDQILIHQNEAKITVNSEPVLQRTYKIGADSKGVYMDFVDYYYEPMRYRLQEFTSDHFIIYVPYNATTNLYSKFELKP